METPKPIENKEENEEKEKYLKKLKFVPITNTELSYPTIKITLTDNKDKKYVNTETIFGEKIGTMEEPFFIFNIKLESLFGDNGILFFKLISKIPDKILLESIKTLNRTFKVKLNLIETEEKLKYFRSYVMTEHFIKNKIYEIYKTLLKKLFFFSKDLFEGVFEEFRKYQMKLKQKMDEISKTSKIPKASKTAVSTVSPAISFTKPAVSTAEIKIVVGSNVQELQDINEIIRANIKYMSELLIFKTPIYDIEFANYVSDNNYQINDGVIMIDSKKDAAEKTIVTSYQKDYINDLKLISKPIGNFYILVKGLENFYGSFNSLIECIFSKKREPPDLSCKKRSPKIKKYFNKVLGINPDSNFEGGNSKRTRRKNRKTQKLKRKSKKIKSN